VKQLNITVEDVVDGETLQAPDLDGLFLFFVHHAGAFAENFGGAHAAATVAQNIRFENYAS